MAIKRYFATADNTITNAFKQNLRQRGTGSNMGEADVLEVFSIYGQTLATGSESGRPSQELSRVLVKFPVSGTAAGEIKGDRTAGVIPKSGSVNFYLRMFNAKHASTLPRDASYTIQAVSQSWVEGTGLDMEEYKDFGESNWMQRAKGADWGKDGGEYWSGSYAPGYTFPTYTVTQEVGPEDIELDITSMVEEWVKGTQENFGLGVRLITTQEAYFSPSTGADLNNGVLKNTSGAKKSYFTKKFFARGSQFFFKRPMIEARWDSSTKDNRGNCKFSSSLAPSADNLNTLYLYNFIDGQLKDIPVIGTTGSIYVQIYSGSAGNEEPAGPNLQLAIGGGVIAAQRFYVTGGHHDTGIYTASFALTSSAAMTLNTIFDVWSSGSATNVHYFTGSAKISKRISSEINITPEYATNISNLKAAYKSTEIPKLRLYTRSKNWNPNIYSKATSVVQNEIIENAYYAVHRLYDNTEAISYGTGSSNLDYTRMSYDVSGNYFDLDMSLLKPDAMYGISLAYYVNGEYHEQPDTFRFRLEK